MSDSSPSADRVLRSTAQRMENLMADIRALGYLPRKTQALGDEYALASRFQHAKDRGLLSESQLAELAELPVYNWREVRKAARMETLMAEIRALGHIPRCPSPKRSIPLVESRLYYRMHSAKRLGNFSESQLAELAEIRGYGVESARTRRHVLNDDV